VVATSNPGKAREFGRLLGEGFRVDPLPAGIDLPEEAGRSFAENAELKATAVFRGLDSATAVLADDSGLEVSALAGAPGVRSARYAGLGASDQENMVALLEALQGHEDRSARFVCHLVLRLPAGTGDPEDQVINAAGILPGSIALAPRGEAGFGYDPVFRPSGWTRTLGEALPGEKDRISHRGAAVRRLRAELQSRGLIPLGNGPSLTR
jgi:XTP/dITP diphosphohydrolase